MSPVLTMMSPGCDQCPMIPRVTAPAVPGIVTNIVTHHRDSKPSGVCFLPSHFVTEQFAAHSSQILNISIVIWKVRVRQVPTDCLG